MQSNEEKPVSVPRNFHRRPLPSTCVAFSSPEGRQRLMRAIASGGGECYWALAEQFTTQAEVTFCGLSTLAMCLNSLNVDPGRIWRGVWRWFSEELLDCCIDLERVRGGGINFSQFHCLATCNGAAVDAVRASDSSEEKFRQVVKRVAASSDSVLALSYSRRTLEQTGDGHFSPCGAYDSESDSILIFDVARFKYPPHWVQISQIFQSMTQIDKETGKCRGWFEIKADYLRSSLLLQIGLSVDRNVMVPKIKNLISTIQLSDDLAAPLLLLHQIGFSSSVLARCCRTCQCQDACQKHSQEENNKETKVVSTSSETIVASSSSSSQPVECSSLLMGGQSCCSNNKKPTLPSPPIAATTITTTTTTTTSPSEPPPLVAADETYVENLKILTNQIESTAIFSCLSASDDPTVKIFLTDLDKTCQSGSVRVTGCHLAVILLFVLKSLILKKREGEEEGGGSSSAAIVGEVWKKDVLPEMFLGNEVDFLTRQLLVLFDMDSLPASS